MPRSIPPSVLVSLALAAALPAAGAAQRAAELPAGARVRLYPPDSGAPSVATLVRAGADTLWVVYDRRADTTRVPATAVQRMQLSRGHEQRTGRGALLGLVIGVGLGAALGAADTERFFGGPGKLAAAFAVPGVIVGTVAGSRRHEIWTPVPLR